MEIRACCKFDRKTIRALTHLSIYKRTEPGKALRFWLIAIGLLLGLSLFNLAVLGISTDLLLCVGAVLAVLGLVCYRHFRLPERQYRKLGKMAETENTYIFKDDSVQVFTDNEAYNASAEMGYDMFVKAYETGTYLFLYIPNRRVYIVQKSTLTGGTMEEIREKLCASEKFRYIICKY